MPRHVKLEDSDNFFSGFDKQIHDLRGLSPLEQVMEIGDHPEWTHSFIRECKSRGIEFIQTWDLNETIEFLIQCDEGIDITPKLRFIPKRYPELSLDQAILMQFKGCGTETSNKLLEQYGSLAKIITYLRKLSEATAKENDLLYRMWKVFK